MRRIVPFLWIFLFCCAPAWADGRPPIHVQIVLDSSGSMRKNDPAELSKLAGMIFNDLAGPQDYVGVVSMQNDRFVTKEIGPISTQRNANRKAISKLRFDGATFCAEPLKLAGEGLAKIRTKEAKQFVIFLSDGACPQTHLIGSKEISAAATELVSDDVRIFSIGLFGDPTNSSSVDLKSMAKITGGEYFPVTQASELPITFANILGRIVGSQAQKIPLKPGKSVDVSLDGYAHDASLILTGSRRATLIATAESPDGGRISIGSRAVPFVVDQKTHFASAQRNASNHYYSVFRLNEPASGMWAFEARGPSDLSALLIQNYALDPVIEVQPDGVVSQNSEVSLRVVLRGKEGKPLTDDLFLKKVDFVLRGTTPSKKKIEVALKKDGTGASGKVTVDEEGEYLFSAHVTMKSGGLNKTSAPRAVTVEGVIVALKNSQPIELGTVKAGERSAPHPLDFTGSQLPTEASLSLSLQGLDAVEVEPDSFTLTGDDAKKEVVFWVRPRHEGGDASGTLKITHGAQTIEVPVTLTVMPLTFWERFGKLVTTIALGLLLLLFLIFVVYGFTSPHSFGSDARLNWGESSRRLAKNEVVIREIPGTGRGFYKNAKLTIGGASSFLPADGVELVTMEATGTNQITITAAENVELLAVNKFDEKKTKPVDGNSCFMNTGELYQVGSLFLRLQ